MAAGHENRRRRRRLAAGLAVLALAGGTYVLLSVTGALAPLMESDGLRRTVESLGAAGPLLVVALMALAIVMSPIPSAPIALAAGAAYGHLWGTVYVAGGSLAGAVAAFSISRYFGYETVARFLGGRPTSGLLDRFLQSQTALMAAVFATRLMPFLSFDIVSYAAGLTPLTAWRFAVATLAGIIPASFLLAHFGDELASADFGRMGLTVLVLGGITALPLLARYSWPHARELVARGRRRRS